MLESDELRAQRRLTKRSRRHLKKWLLINGDSLNSENRAEGRRSQELNVERAGPKSWAGAHGLGER
jgi:hypothetical protein